MFEIGEFLSEIPDALVASLASRERRNAAAGRLIGPPPPGTPLLVSLALAVEHTGIYLGNNHVAELEDDGSVAKVSLTHFLNGAPDAELPLRNGTRIFAACDAFTRKPIGNERTFKLARKAAKLALCPGYDLVQSNCHLFCASCAAGILPRGEKYRALSRMGLMSIAKLERVLAKEMNDGRKIAWCAVRRGKEDFHYKLTDEKVARLRLEGKL